MGIQRKTKNKECGTKIAYPNQKTATLAELTIRLNTGEHRRMRAYPCRFCGKWHLGHRTNKR